MTVASVCLLHALMVSSRLVSVRVHGERRRHHACGQGPPEAKNRYIRICADHHRFGVVFWGMYLSCRDPLAIIYRGVLIFFRVTVEIWDPLVMMTVMK